MLLLAVCQVYHGLDQNAFGLILFSMLGSTGVGRVRFAFLKFF